MPNLQEMIMQFLTQNGRPKPQVMGTGMARGAGESIDLRRQLNEAIARGDYETAQKIQDAMDAQNQTQPMQ